MNVDILRWMVWTFSHSMSYLKGSRIKFVTNLASLKRIESAIAFSVNHVRNFITMWLLFNPYLPYSTVSDCSSVQTMNNVLLKTQLQWFCSSQDSPETPRRSFSYHLTAHIQLGDTSLIMLGKSCDKSLLDSSLAYSPAGQVFPIYTFLNTKASVFDCS